MHVFVWLLTLAIFLVACGSTQTLISSTPLPQPTTSPLLHFFRLPEWQILELPPDCNVGSVSQDTSWITYHCRTFNGTYTGKLAHIEASHIVSPTDLPFDPWRYRFGFSSDNSRFLILDGSSSCKSLELPTYSYQNCSSQILAFSNPAESVWSPDGTSFIVASGLFTDVIISRLANLTTPKYLQKFNNNGTLFSWSPDSQALVFVDDSPPKMTARIYFLDGHKPQTLLHREHLSGASWSPNGKWIAVREVTDGQTALIHLFDLTTGTQIDLKFADLLSMQDGKNGWSDLVWSPDSSKLIIDGWNPLLKHDWIVITVPSGEIVFRSTEYSTNFIGWDVAGENVLITQWNSDKENDILKWVSTSPSNP